MPRLRAADLRAVIRRNSRRRGAPLWPHPQSEAQPQEANTLGRLCSHTLHRRPHPVHLMPLLAAKADPRVPRTGRACWCVV